MDKLLSIVSYEEYKNKRICEKYIQNNNTNNNRLNIKRKDFSILMNLKDNDTIQ